MVSASPVRMPPIPRVLNEVCEYFDDDEDRPA
jgi:hypothetical protein